MYKQLSITFRLDTKNEYDLCLIEKQVLDRGWVINNIYGSACGCDAEIYTFDNNGFIEPSFIRTYIVKNNKMPSESLIKKWENLKDDILICNVQDKKIICSIFTNGKIINLNQQLNKELLLKLRNRKNQNNSENKILPIKRKKRTKEHIIGDLGVNYVHTKAIEAGFSIDRVQGEADYGIDLNLYDQMIHCKHIQMKASGNCKYIYDNKKQYLVYKNVNSKDLANWLNHKNTVMLCVYDVKKNEAFWLDIKEYFKDVQIEDDMKYTVHIPVNQKINSINLFGT